MANRSSTPSAGRAGRRGGFTLTELLVVLLVLAALAACSFHIVRQSRLTRQCTANLRKIYSALETYEIDRGTLPRLAFYPDDPKQDNDSLITVLQPYGAGGAMYICPATPEILRNSGLTYAWNVQLNGKKLRAPGAPSWMMTELNALSGNVPAPHLGSYNVLYADGRVQPAKEPPAGLQTP
jgi:prepilin-type N-terminal cleavage/methylation domain-containing protein/prepilin-type processing-associated H-X9-DG protein